MPGPRGTLQGWNSVAAKEIAQTHTRGIGAKHTRGSGVAMTNAQVLRLQLSNLGVPPSWYKTSGRDAMASCAVAIGARGQFFTAGPEGVRISIQAVMLGSSSGGHGGAVTAVAVQAGHLTE